MTREEVIGAVARGWCHPRNSHKEMDSDLALAIADEIWDALNPPNLGCATTSQLLAEISARIEVGAEGLNYRTVGHALDPIPEETRRV